MKWIINSFMVQWIISLFRAPAAVRKAPDVTIETNLRDGITETYTTSTIKERTYDYTVRKEQDEELAKQLRKRKEKAIERIRNAVIQFTGTWTIYQALYEAHLDVTQSGYGYGDDKNIPYTKIFNEAIETLDVLFRAKEFIKERLKAIEDLPLLKQTGHSDLLNIQFTEEELQLPIIVEYSGLPKRFRALHADLKYLHGFADHSLTWVAFRKLYPEIRFRYKENKSGN